jgi:hypothetical protein
VTNFPPEDESRAIMSGPTSSRLGALFNRRKA